MKVLLSAALTLFCLSIFGQIEIREKDNAIVIGEIKRGGSFTANIKQRIENTDTVYTYMFKNGKYQNIVDLQYITFTGQKTLSDLYTLLKSVYLPENKKNTDYRVGFKLGKTECSVRTERVMGITATMFWTEKGYNSYSEKEIDKLFGK